MSRCPLTCHAALSPVQVAADRRQLNDFAVQRLQHGFFWFAAIVILLHLIHLLFVKTLTFWGLLIGELVAPKNVETLEQERGRSALSAFSLAT